MKSPADMRIIQIEITNACARRCSNCTRFCGHHRKPFFMDFACFKRAVDSLRGFQGMVGIMGGEPTLHPEFEKFVSYYRARIGYDIVSAGSYDPAPHFISRILSSNCISRLLAKAARGGNQRALFTSLGRKYYEHFELIQDTFGYQLVNDHSRTSRHTVLMATRKELGISDEAWAALREQCWVQNFWSASITPKGAFFCEVAAALDMTLGGPGGWEIEPGWWRRTPADFTSQLRWCELCSAALPMPKRDARDEIDDVSPLWRKRLRAIRSPKLHAGLCQELSPAAYRQEEHTVIRDGEPYLQGQRNRVGTAETDLRPRNVRAVAWLTKALGTEPASRLLRALKAAGIPFCAVAVGPAESARLFARVRSQASDWILLLRDMAPTRATLALLKRCVYNPGCLYWDSPRDGPVPPEGPLLQFFNVRALALRRPTGLFDIAAAYPQQKVVRLPGGPPSRLLPMPRAARQALRRLE